MIDLINPPSAPGISSPSLRSPTTPTPPSRRRHILQVSDGLQREDRRAQQAGHGAQQGQRIDRGEDREEDHRVLTSCVFCVSRALLLRIAWSNGKWWEGETGQRAFSLAAGLLGC